MPNKETTTNEIEKHEVDRQRMASVLLFFSGLILFGGIILMVLIIAILTLDNSGGGEVAGMVAVILLTKAGNIFLCATWLAIGLLALYAMVQQPWREGRKSTAFMLQLPMALIAGLATTWLFTASY